MSKVNGITVFVDFDDTLTTRNVAQFLLKRFAPGAFARYSAQYRAKKITFREYQEMSFDAVPVSVEEMQDAVSREIELRTGAHELAAAVTKAGGKLAVISAGLDIYIKPVLTRHGLESIDVICGRASRNGSETGPFRYDYSFAGADGGECEGDWATCKCRAVKNATGSATTVFVGDGSTSDACAAAKADYVFARDRLLKACAGNGTKAEPFEDLLPVAEFVGMLSKESVARPVQR